MEINPTSPQTTSLENSNIKHHTINLPGKSPKQNDDTFESEKKPLAKPRGAAQKG